MKRAPQIGHSWASTGTGPSQRGHGTVSPERAFWSSRRMISSDFRRFSRALALSPRRANSFARRTQRPGYVSFASTRASRAPIAPRRSPIVARAEAFAKRASVSFGSIRTRSSAILRIIAARSDGGATTAGGASVGFAVRTGTVSEGGVAKAPEGASGLMISPRPARVRNLWNRSSGAVSFIERTPIFRTIASPSRRRSMSITPSNGWETLETVAGLCISFSRRKRAVNSCRASFALLLCANAYTWSTSNTWRAGDSTSSTARRRTPGGRVPSARLNAIPTFVRSTEHRITCSSSSTPATFLSL